MSELLMERLDVCLSAVGSGVDLEACLALYPDEADDLRPALEAAIMAQELGAPDVPTDARHRSRARVLGRAAELRAAPRRNWGGLLLRPLSIALAALFVIVLTFSGVGVAAAPSLPGDTLYSLKRAAESINLQLTTDPIAQYNLEALYQQRRAEEVQRLLDEGRIEAITFEGRLALESDNRWLVGDIPIQLSSRTHTAGLLESGQIVVVEGQTASAGFVRADAIVLRAFDLTGSVRSIGADRWTIAPFESRYGEEISVLIGPVSLIESGIELGDTVFVLVRIQANGSWLAQAILALPQTGQGAQPSAPLVVPNAAATEGSDDENALPTEGGSGEDDDSGHSNGESSEDNEDEEDCDSSGPGSGDCSEDEDDCDSSGPGSDDCDEEEEKEEEDEEEEDEEDEEEDDEDD